MYDLIINELYFGNFLTLKDVQYYINSIVETWDDDDSIQPLRIKIIKL